MSTTVLQVVIGVAGAVALAAVLVAIIAHQRRPGRVRARSEQHEALLAFLRDLANQPEIVMALQRRSGISMAGLLRTVNDSGDWSERVLRSVMAELMADRIVRRLIAAHLRRRGADHERVMAELLALKETA